MGTSHPHWKKRSSLLCNLTRCALILFCGYHVLFASLDALQAERMLGMTQLPPEDHEALSPTPEIIQSIRRVLRRHGPSSINYAVVLVVLALIPYCQGPKRLIARRGECATIKSKPLALPQNTCCAVAWLPFFPF